MRENKRNGIRHILAMVLFCMVLSIGMVCLADVQGTVIAKSAVIRASADPNSEKLASVPSGKTIDIISKTSGTDNNTWYQVYVNSDTKGYIRSDLIKVPDGVNIPTTQGGAAASSTDAPSTTATPVEARQVSVLSNNTNIRAEASTNSESRAKANRGTVLTVVGEATGTDGKKWYQVSFTYGSEEKTGYIRSDLVTSDNVPADTATSQITGEENPGEEQPPAETTPPEEQQPEQPAETAPTDNNNVIPMNVEEVPYIMPGFELITLSADGEGYNAYKNGAFLIFYGRKQSGEEGWFLFDAENHIYQRYVYTTEGITQPNEGIGSVGLISVIVLVVIIVVLVAVVGLLLIKLKGQGNSYKRYKSYDDDDQDDDIEDLEDMEDDDDEPQPARRPQGPQPVRRPQGAPSASAPQGQQPRRPQGQQPPRHPQSQQPPRRPQGSLSNGSAPQQGGQPSRRPQGGTASNNGGAARPQGQQPPRRPQGNANGQPPRRPQQQNERVPNEKGQAQKGYKAKNLLEDDDMDFMDIE